MQPPLAINCLGRLDRVTVVPTEDVGAAVAHLSPALAPAARVQSGAALRVNLAVVHGVGHQVAHLRHRNKLDLIAGGGSAHVSDAPLVIERREARRAAGLGHAVSLAHPAPEDEAQELHHVRRDGRAACRERG